MAVTTAVSLDSGLTTLRGAAVSPSGRLAVTYGVDVLVFSLTLWDVATQRPIRQIETGRAPMTVSFTPDEAAILGVLLSRDDGSAEVIRWLATDTAEPGEVLHTETGVAGVAMARDTGTVVFRYATGSVTVLTTPTGLTQPVGQPAEVEQVAVSSRGTLVALATAKGIDVVRMPSNGVVALTSYVPGSVQAMDCTEDAVLVAAESTVSAVYGARQGVIFTGADPVREMALSTAGDVLAVAQRGRIDLLDLRTTATIDQISASSPVERLTFSLEDSFLITAHEDNTARLWDLTSAREGRRDASGSAQGSGHGSGAPARFSRLSASSLRALEYADGLRNVMDRGEVHMDHLLAGLTQGGDSAQQMLDQAGIGRWGLLSALDSLMGLTSLPTVTPRALRSTPPLSRHAGEALDRALGFADAAGSAVIRSQDLLRAALSVTDCSLVQELGQRGVSLAALDALDAADRRPAPRAPLLPGAAADTVPEPGEGRVREADRLGIAAEVEMLVSILMASDTPLPLAVGLFGDWGSGKSFFMALMQERIDELARLSSQGQPEAQPFCDQVRQVRFNAWHYVDTNLWASLAATLFDELASTRAQDDVEVTVDQAKLAQLHEARQQRDTAQQQRQELELEVSELAGAVDRPAAAVKSAVSVAISAVRGRKIRQNLADARDSQDQDDLDPDTARLISTLGEIDGVAANARAGWRLFQEELLDRQRRKPTLITLAVLLAAAAVAAVVLNSSAAIKAWTFVGAVLVGLAPALTGAVRVLYLVREARDARELPLVRKREELEKARAKERGAEQEVALREQELARLRDKGLRLQEFIRERAASADYRGRLGVISQVRRDFEQLAALVPGRRSSVTAQDGAQQVAAVAEAVTERVPEVQRIILYIDDLDRCPSEKVVEVLQAVHLLLAFKLFVVVVGVDSRWLERSLAAHYQDLLEEPGNYLEKIFQIPFILQRMTPSRYQDLIEGLTALVGQPSEGPTVPSPRIAPPDATPDIHTTKSQDAPEGQYTAVVETVLIQRLPEAQSQAEAQGTATAARQAPPVPSPPPALPRPEALVISAGERALLGRLGGIVPTPRAAKRLVNIYRMLRVSVPEGELEVFGPDSDGGGEYQAVILLLALLVGRPDEAGDIFTALRAAGDGDDMWQVLDSYSAARQKVQDSPAAGGGDVTAALGTLREHVTVSSAGPYRRWAPRVARFSFRLGTVPPGDEW